MKDVSIEQRKQELMALKTRLLELADSSADAGDSVELDQSRVGRLSRMDAMQAQQMALETHRRRQHQLLAIEGALRRIQTGDYGACFICGRDISSERLGVNPATTRCVGCIDH